MNLKKPKMPQKIDIISYASCYGAQDQRCDSGPIALKNLQLTEKLESLQYSVNWAKTIRPDHVPKTEKETLELITNNCKELARQTHRAVDENRQIVVIGGDHSCAIGTWSGVFSALQHATSIGLIWIDAHMDSHTMQTSISGAIHGMPVAALLGHGDPGLCSIESSENKLKPQNLCLVGVRSFEPEEAQLLNKLGVKIFYMSDIQTLGLSEVLKQARQHVTRHCDKYGISLDLDAIDPEDAPGVGSPETHGICGKELLNALKICQSDNKFIGIEITELNSSRDHVDKTAKLAIDAILAAFTPIAD